jgi:enoyl-CoA hydratase/carnithine racemase
VPAEQVLPVAIDLASEYAESCSPLVMAQSKRLVWAALDQARRKAEIEETGVLTANMGSSDALEGGMAYVERRAPRWQASVSTGCPEIQAGSGE